MNAPVVYCAHPDTREYVLAELADPDPLDPENWLIPANAYLDAPPASYERTAVVRSEDGSEWLTVADFRGEVYSTETGEAQQHYALGELPPGLTGDPRPSEDHLWVDGEWVFDQALRDANRVKLEERLCGKVDSAADSVRRAIVGDPTRALEYMKAAEEAQAFKDAGYPPEAIPRTVAAYMLGGRSAQDSADSILSEAEAYNGALYFLREQRLAAKEAVRAAVAAGDDAAAQQLAQDAMDLIRAISGVGNARG